jgi:hypothetical protein
MAFRFGSDRLLMCLTLSVCALVCSVWLAAMWLLLSRLASLW